MSKDEIIIFVNGQKHSIQSPEISGIAILKLAGYEEPPAGTILIDYHGGPVSDPAGTIKPEDTIKIKEGMVFDVKEDIRIIVNAREKALSQQTITREELVDIAATDDPSLKQGGVLTIDYRNGPRGNPDGVFEEGQTLEIKNGMIFNVSATNRS